MFDMKFGGDIFSYSEMVATGSGLAARTANRGEEDNYMMVFPGVYEDGTPNTAHSLNPVPFVYVTENKNAKVENGVLADVAPSILHILGMPQPADMTGRDLIK